MTGAADARLAALEAALRQAVATGRLGPRVPAEEREAARRLVSLVWLVEGSNARQVVLARLLVDPETGEPVSWSVIGRDLRISAERAEAIYRRSLATIAAELVPEAGQ